MKLIPQADGSFRPQLTEEEKRIKTLHKRVTQLENQVELLLKYLSISKEDLLGGTTDDK